MKRARNNLQYSERRRFYLDATRFGPAVKLVVGALLVAGFAAVVILLLVPFLTEQIAARRAAQPVAAQQETSLSAAPLPVEPGTFVADVSGCDGKLLFAAGPEAGKPDAVLCFDPAAGTVEPVPTTVANDFLRYPVGDETRLIYLDAKAVGGGAVRLLDRASGETAALYELSAGTPALAYEAPYLAFTERMADGTAALRVLDVTTRETVTVADFETSAYGASAPSICSGQLVYADENPEDLGTSLLRTVLLETGKRWDFNPGGTVHDPQSAGDRWAWLDGAHGPAASLLVSVGGGSPVAIAKGVNAFYLTYGYVVYGKDAAVYAYGFSSGDTEVISDPASDCLPVGAGSGYAVWQDVETASYHFRKLG